MRRRNSYGYGGNQHSGISKVKLVMGVIAVGSVALAGNAMLASTPSSRSSAYTPWQAQNQAGDSADSSAAAADSNQDEGFDLFSLLPPARTRKGIADTDQDVSLTAVKDTSVFASKRLNGGRKSSKPSPKASPSSSPSPSGALDLVLPISGAGNSEGNGGNGNNGNGGNPSPSPSPSETSSPDPTPTPSPSPSQSPGDTTLPITPDFLQEAAEEAAGSVPPPPSEDSIWETIPQAIKDLFQSILDRIEQFFAPEGDLETAKSDAGSEAAARQKQVEDATAGPIGDAVGQATGAISQVKAAVEAAPGTVAAEAAARQKQVEDATAGPIGDAVGQATGAISQVKATAEAAPGTVGATKDELTTKVGNTIPPAPEPPTQESIWEMIPQAIKDLFQSILDRIEQFFAPDGDLETARANAEEDAEEAGRGAGDLKGSAEAEAARVAASGMGLVTGTAATAQELADSAPGTIGSAAGTALAVGTGAVGTAENAAKPVTDAVKATLENPPSLHTIRLDSTVLLNSSDSNGTSIPVAAGHTYTIKISGVYKYGTYISPALETLDADASCARPFIFDGLGGGAIGDWISNPEIHDPANPGSNHLNVLLNGQAIDWAPESPGSDPLCSSNHVYTYTFTPSEAVSLMTLKVNDYGSQDNIGALRVDISDTFQSPTSTGQEMWPHPWGMLFLGSLLMCECALRLISSRRRNGRTQG